ncbi:MAG: phosphosulfolactate synthase [Rhodobacteraceae bacterium]|nr:phosphosulfolactate synthase [Paracoccaceae bacterium]
MNSPTTGKSEPFALVGLPVERSRDKPRAQGHTMMIDWGIPLLRQRDILEMAGRYIDFAKIAVGTSRFYDETYLTAKLDLYKAHGVRPFLGGQFQEYMFATQGAQALRPFLEEALRLGFEVVEVSDNVIPLTDEERSEQIRLAVDVGLTVLGEVGSKSEQSSADVLISQGNQAFEAGAELVLIEGAELIENGVINSDMLGAFQQGLDMTRVMIELPGPWVPDTSLSQIHDLKKALIRLFGADVNLANIMPDDIIETESLRCGLGVVGPQRGN